MFAARMHLRGLSLAFQLLFGFLHSVMEAGCASSCLSLKQRPSTPDVPSAIASTNALVGKHLLPLFQQAVLEKNETKMKQLVQEVAPNLGIGYYSVLHYCASMENSDYLRIYLSQSPQPELNPRTNRGETPLMLAFQEGCDEVIQLLLEQNGLDVHAVDEDGWSLLMYAAKDASPKQFKQFLAYPTTTPLDVNHQSRFGNSALKVLSEGTVSLVKLNIFFQYANGRLEISDREKMMELILLKTNQRKAVDYGCRSCC